MIRYLSSTEAAEAAGLSPNTFRSYMRKGLAPNPDVVVGARQPIYGWLPETVDHWMANRVGRGHRTDLER